MACFMSSCISDTAEFPFLEVPSPYSFQQAAISHSELPTHQTAIGPIDDKGCKQGLTRTVDQNSSMQTTLSWDASHMVGGISSDSHEVIQLGILQETLPEEMGSISLDSFNSLESNEIKDENSRDSRALPDSVAGSEQKLNFQSIWSRCEVLEKTVPENSPSRKQIPRCKSEFSLTPVSLDTNDVLSPFRKPYALDAELFKTPACTTLLERKIPLSPLISFSPVQLRERPELQESNMAKARQTGDVHVASSHKQTEKRREGAWAHPKGAGKAVDGVSVGQKENALRVKAVNKQIGVHGTKRAWRLHAAQGLQVGGPSSVLKKEIYTK
ncbi:HAUS augmin-like complex subunit 6 [Varanus komodoensis]|nr:HAUS augmin-like complex subunit 6 [Varanus komodoensis]